ncbi:mitochondrial ribosomal protein L11 [Amylocystis lapponica]|nr:mitochondrial ribosomal protein L11 [Amylocystis lapponica]
MAAQARAQVVRILVAAGQAVPTPPTGPVLTAHGIRPITFCKEFNKRTAHIERGVPIPTIITIQPDRSFMFITKTPPTAYFLKQAASISRGTGQPRSLYSGTVSLKHVYEIAKIKATDDHLKGVKLEAIARAVIGTAKAMGVRVVP